MNQTDADRLANIAVTSWIKRGLPIDVWAEELLELDADPEAVELALRRLRRRSDDPPQIATLRAELRSSSSTTPPRPSYAGAISIEEALAGDRLDADTAATLARYRRRDNRTKGFSGNVTPTEEVTDADTDR